MEMQQKVGNVGEKEGGQPSRSRCQTGPEAEEHRIDITEISPTVKFWIGCLKKAEKRTQSQTQWPRTPKVPQMLRGTQDFKKFYEPRVISIGPYHHGKPHLHPGEMIKLLCARDFLADVKRDIADLYTKIESNIVAVRKCYDKRPTNKYGDEALAWMMLLDGCFLLYFIHCLMRNNKRKLHDLNVKGHMINFVLQDLFLLENQLPFGVLKLIFEGTSLQMEEKMKEFVTHIGRPEGSSQSTSETQLKEEDKEPSHLLDLLRSALLGPEQKQTPLKKAKSSSSQGRDGGFCFPWNNAKKRGIRHSFRNIKELKAAGIYVKPSRTSSLTDISFNSYFFYGYLKLPPLIIDDLTKPRFLNIVACEMCLDGPDDYAVSSYICFLDDLIDQADDVKELRSRHILYNCLGSDEDVARIFNEISNGLLDCNAYRGVKESIQKHYDKRVNTWIAQALHDHFRSPWTIMAFIAAVFILFLTGVQTYYALPGK